MALHQKICENCGGTIIKPRKYSARQWAEQRFCSRTCAAGVIRKVPGGVDRFFDHFIPEPNSGCWLWTGALNGDGYGQIMIDRVLYRAHRLSFIIHCGGRIPDELGILHHCDNRACVNPDHLYAGTSQDNSNDMVARGRLPVGDRNHATKLTPSAVREIRSSADSNALLALRFRVSRTAIRLARAGENWSHLR